MTRYLVNPFVKDLVIPVKNKQVQISKLGADDNIIVSQKTGEVLGGTSVVTYKKVDQSQFVKIFTQNIKLAFELTQSGQKALYVLFWVVQQGKPGSDLVSLDQITYDSFMSCNSDLKMSLSTFKRGLAELVKCKIIAMHQRKGFYFINPNFVFNGDRIAFTTVIELEKSKNKTVLENKL